MIFLIKHFEPLTGLLKPESEKSIFNDKKYYFQA